VKPAARLLGHSSMAVWRVSGGHGKQSEAHSIAEVGRAEMGVGVLKWLRLW
jgi:hypothetical protein